MPEMLWTWSGGDNATVRRLMMLAASLVNDWTHTKYGKAECSEQAGRIIVK